MSTRPLVKICGITRLEDAELAVELGADALGFVLEPTSRRSIHVNMEALDIPARIGPYAMCVAVLGPYRPTPNYFHLIQCLEDTPATEQRPTLRVLRLEQGMAVDDVLDEIGDRAAILLDAYDAKLYGGTGQTVDWDLAAEVVDQTSAKVILAGGLTPENVAEAVARVKPYAVDVSGGVEAQSGIKDHGKLRAFVQAVKA